MTYEEIIDHLEKLSDQEAAAGMARFGIRAAKVYGVPIPELRRMAKRITKHHGLASELWKNPCRETRILAAMVEEPALVSSGQMEDWVIAFDSWEVCDQVCMNLFEKLPWAYEKALEWSRREEEFVKRAGFVLMARLAVSDKTAENERFTAFFPAIRRESPDQRTYVKKAVNWALRQIGKRNLALHSQAVRLAQKIRSQESPAARWIAADALRELQSEAVLRRMKERKR